MLRVILLALLAVLVARFLWRLVNGIMGAARGVEPARRGGKTQAMKLERDPVCGTHVPPRAALSLTSAGSTYYFCSEECKAAFGARG